MVARCLSRIVAACQHLKTSSISMASEKKFLTAQTFNVVQLGIGFLLVFSAFNAQGFVEELVITAYHNDAVENNSTSPINENAGFYSLGVIYAVFTFANFLAPPIVTILGAKWAMVIGAMCYASFLASFLILTEWLLYVMSGVIGLGAAIIWTGQGNYLTMNSNQETIGRNSAMLWALLQSGLLVAGVFLYVAFGRTDDPNIKIADSRMVYSVFAVAATAGAVVLALLRPAHQPPISQDEESETSQLVTSTREDIETVGTSSSTVDGVQVVHPPIEMTVGQKWMASMSELIRELTFSLAFTKDMLMLGVVFLFTGIEITFWTGIYATCLGRTLGFGPGKNRLLAYNSVCIGVGEIVGGGTFGILGHRTNIYGRNPIIMLGTIVHLIAYFLIWMNIPGEAALADTHLQSYLAPSIPLALVCSFLLGLADSCWNTQCYSILGALYPGNEESSAAFALFKFYQSAGACASFYWGAQLQLQWQLLILVVGVGIGALTFFPVEWKAQMRPKVSSD